MVNVVQERMTAKIDGDFVVFLIGRALLHPVTRHQSPAGPDWLHEIKHDCYRLIVQRETASGCSIIWLFDARYLVRVAPSWDIVRFFGERPPFWFGLEVPVPFDVPVLCVFACG